MIMHDVIDKICTLLLGVVRTHEPWVPGTHGCFELRETCDPVDHVDFNTLTDFCSNKFSLNLL